MKKLLAIALSAIGPMISSAQTSQQIIRTVVGGPGSGAATSLSTNPYTVATDASGNLYIADARHFTIQKMDASGNITVVAGSGTNGFRGDGGPATAAQIGSSYGIVVDASGNIYVSDLDNNRVRKVSTSGIITTIAGTGAYGYTGDGGPATAAQLNSPHGLALDASGNLYICDEYNGRIRKVSTSGIITTVAGGGSGGDGAAATAAALSFPIDVKVDASGNMYISDLQDEKIRKVNTAGIISTVAGNGTAGYNGEGMQATLASLYYCFGIALDAAGNLYICDDYNFRIRKVNAAGVISTVAGTGTNGFSGDGGPATSAQLSYSVGIAFDPAGNMYLADRNNNRVRKVNTAGIISTVVGNGAASFSGDGGPALNAQFDHPYATCFDASGNMYVSDPWNHRVRKITTAGIVSTIAGNGATAWVGDNIPATTSSLNNPLGMAVDASGNVYIADANQHRIRKVAANGVITTIAGTGVAGFSGDGAAANLAQLNSPYDVKLDAAGNLYIADYLNNRIRKIDASGIITTIAGTGIPTFGGDGSAATAAFLVQPQTITFDTSGNLYFSDMGNYRIRKINAAGIITTVAGNGTASWGGATGPATAAAIFPAGLTVDSAANLYMTDNVSRIRKIDANGIISTFSGVDSADFYGDGVPVGLAHLNHPSSVTMGPLGAIYVTDCTNDRIRKIDYAVSPAISIAASQNGICAGTSVQFTATAANGGTAPVYHWKKNGNSVGTNSVTYTYAPANGDIISCVLISTDPAAFPDTAVSATVVMNVMPVVKPTAIVLANPASNATSGQPITFSISSTGIGANPLYQWRKNAVNITGATAATYVATANFDVVNNDQISVWVKNTDSCGADTVSNNWTVVVLGSTGVNAINGNAGVAIYPNPNNGSFTVTGQLADNRSRTITLEVCNSVGQQIYRQNVAVANGTINQKIDLQKQAAPGLYFVRIVDGDKPRNLVVEIK
ncbi:NHL domain-containing protein [Taibaiella soli]|uniref:Uncharacterized protein n=1 Tax=Taibaiella soli TaxID=1649169 RepID=A0A2W2AF53_9BACT|nr:T9SS type A sorting domain-containing protein [Taibaiella soli]PZF72192.1 hypothetical protein DN068_14760 [Taibaiella soli]